MSYFCMQIFQQNIDTVLSRSTSFAHRPAAKSLPGPPWRPQNPAWGLQNRFLDPPGDWKTQPEALLGAQNAPRRHPKSAGRSPRTPKRLQEAAQKRPKGAPGRPRAPKMRPRGTLQGRFRSVFGSQDHPRLAANRVSRPASLLDRFRSVFRPISDGFPKLRNAKNLPKPKEKQGSGEVGLCGRESENRCLGRTKTLSGNTFGPPRTLQVASTGLARATSSE